MSTQSLGGCFFADFPYYTLKCPFLVIGDALPTVAHDNRQLRMPMAPVIDELVNRLTRNAPVIGELFKAHIRIAQFVTQKIKR